MVHDKEHSAKEGSNNRSIGGWIVRLVFNSCSFRYNIFLNTWLY